MDLRTAKSALMFALLLLPGCGDDDKPTKPSSFTPPTNPPPPLTQALAFTRADSTGVAMGDSMWICCGVWDDGYIDKTAFKVVLFDPANHKSGWRLFVLPEVEIGRVYSLPTISSTPTSQSPVNLFIADYSNGNELASDQDESRGTMVVHSLSCGPPARIDISIDAVLGSEFGDGPEMRAYGRFQVEASPTSDCSFGY